MYPREVCHDMVLQMSDVLMPNLLNSVFKPEYFCSRVSGFCNRPKYIVKSSKKYVDNLIAEKPEHIKDNEFISNLYEEIKQDPNPRPTVKIMHMSDIHLDFEYKVGANTYCGKPICCREEDGWPTNPDH